MINTTNLNKAYSEVYAFINSLGDTYKNKIPTSLYNTIETRRDINYKPIYNESTPISTQNMSHEALALISALNLQYWCDSKEEKENLKSIYYDNEKNFKESLDPFKSVKPVDSTTKQLGLIEIKKENIFIRMLNAIKNIFVKQTDKT